MVGLVKFVLLCPRRGAEVLAAEYSDFLQFSGLAPDSLEQRPLDTPQASLGDFKDVAGVFIGGSPFTITQPYESHWQEEISQKLSNFVAEQAASGELPVLSACYGASMLAHYLGGEVDSTYSESAGTSVVKLTEDGLKDAIASSLPTEFTVLTGHKDSVITLPPDATLLGTNKACPVQLYRLGDTVWTSQFHPEMDAAAITRRLSFYEAEGYCDPQELEQTYANFRGADTAAVNGLLRRFVEFCLQR